MRQLRVAVVPCNPSLTHHLAEEHSIHLREFGGFAERKRSLSIECDGEFAPEPLRNLPLRNSEALEHRVRDVQGHPHAPTIPRFGGRKPPAVVARPQHPPGDQGCPQCLNRTRNKWVQSRERKRAVGLGHIPRSLSSCRQPLSYVRGSAGRIGAWCRICTEPGSYC